MKTRKRWAAALLIAVSIMALAQAFPYMSQPVYGATLSHIFAQIAPFQTDNGTTETGTTATGPIATGTTAAGTTAEGTTATGTTATGTTATGTTATGTTAAGTIATGTTATGTTATGTTATGTTATGTTATGITETTPTSSTSSSIVSTTTTTSTTTLITSTASTTGSVPTISVTINSFPQSEGLVLVDGSFIDSPQSYTWIPGTTHGLFAVFTAFSPPCNCQATFLYWTARSFGAVYSQALTYTVPSSAETVTAVYQVYQITQGMVSITIASVPYGSNSIYVDGTLITTPQTFNWNMGSTHTLTANQYCAISGCQTQFSYWQSSSIGTINAASFAYTVPTYSESVTAYYQAAQNVPIVVTETPTGSGTLGVDGNQITASQTFYWTPGSTHQLSAQNGNGQFVSWTSPSIGTESANTITYVVPSSEETVTANYNAPASNTFSFAFGAYGSGDGQFKNPHFIAIDSSGNTYVTDSNNGRVEKFDRSGNYVTQWGSFGSGNGQFSEPTGIAVDSFGNVYVVDSNNHHVEKFASSGTYLSQFGSLGSGNGQFEDPIGIAIDSSGNVYVADDTTNRVQEFTSSGTYLNQFGSPGAGNGQFGGATGITIDSSSGNIYVVDYPHHRVEEFTSTGTYVTQWGSVGSGNGQFTYPYGIAVDSSGRIYVTDLGNYRVEVFTNSGTYLTQFGSEGVGNGQFVNPTGVAIDSSGNVYVVDNVNNRVEVFHP